MNGGICWIRRWMKRERNEEGGRIEILIGGGIGDDIDFDGKLVFSLQSLK